MIWVGGRFFQIYVLISPSPSLESDLPIENFIFGTKALKQSLLHGLLMEEFGFGFEDQMELLIENFVSLFCPFLV